MIPSVRSKALLAATILLASVSLAEACNYHDGALGVFDGKFRALYPKSSVVYFAIVDAVEQGLLERAAFEPAGEGGYWNAAARLNELARRLPAPPAPGAPAISLVLIESDLWARYEPAAEGYGVAVHVPGPRAGDVMVVTSEAAIVAVLERRLPVEAALERGLIAIDGGAAAAVQRLLLSALDPAAAPVSARQAPVRLFGPPR
jgi:hypothetical protein